MLKVTDMTERERLAWCAGFMSLKGSFTYGTFNSKGRIPKRYICYTVRHAGDKETLEQFLKIAKLKYKVSRHKINSANSWSTKVAGKNLDDFMLRVWDFLTEERQQQYMDLEVMVQEYNERLVNERR
jgi:hypothetical protein